MSIDKRAAIARSVRAELVRDSLRKGAAVRTNITTASMSPALLPGDELLVHSSGTQELHAGDIVLYERSDVIFAHRLIRVERKGSEVWLITKGDATAHYDPPVSVNAYLGKATQVIRAGRAINLEGPGARLDARLLLFKLVLKTMRTRLVHSIQGHLGITFALAMVLVLFAAGTASAAVSVSSFNADGNQGQITLTWTTATEINNFGFTLLRSTDQSNWTKVASVSSDLPCASSVTGSRYSYTDKSTELVPTTIYFYRLQLNGSPCGEADQYYTRIVSAAPNGSKSSAQQTPTATSVPPTATATSVPPTATGVPPTLTPTPIPPTATATNVPQATSTSTPQNVAAPTNTPVATNTVPAPANPAGVTPSPTVRSASAPRATPTATQNSAAPQSTATAAAETPATTGNDQPTATDVPSTDVTASPQPTELAMAIATDTPSSQNPQSSRRPAQTQPTPAPAADNSLLVGLGLLSVLGMGGAGLLLLGLAGVMLWRYYARG